MTEHVIDVTEDDPLKVTYAPTGAVLLGNSEVAFRFRTPEHFRRVIESLREQRSALARTSVVGQAKRGLPRRFIEDLAADPPSYCVYWPFARYNGYAKVADWRADRRADGHHPIRPAYRIAWELHNGRPFPPGLMARHLCGYGHLGCVNPVHVVPGTAAENVADMMRMGRHNPRRGPTHPGSRRTHCPQGHPYDEANTQYCADGSRRCGACNAARSLRWRRRRAVEGVQPTWGGWSLSRGLLHAVFPGNATACGSRVEQSFDVPASVVAESARCQVCDRRMALIAEVSS